MPKPPSDWITLAEAAELFGAANVRVSADTLRKWAAAGKLQSIRPGHRIYVRRAQVRALLTPRQPAMRLDDQPGLFEVLDSRAKSAGRRS
jgi:excisionase family DNA binding protein